MKPYSKIFITGASGMVGRNIVDALKDYSPKLLTPRHEELDLEDQQAVRAYLLGNTPDLIIHCAGKVGGIAANMQDPTHFLADNLRINLNLITEAHKAGVKKFLNLGSSCMYPADSTIALTEDKILSGTLEATNEGYAIAKCAAARLCEYISRQYPDFQYKSLIPCNLYGPYDKFDPIRAHLIPAIILKIDKALSNNDCEVEIWGSGEARREFMFAGDLAKMIVMAVERFEELPSIMNVGIGEDFTINEYYQKIADILGYSGHFIHDLHRPEGMRRKLVDISKQKAFGFTPKHDLEAGIRKTYKWYKAQQKAKNASE